MAKKDEMQNTTPENAGESVQDISAARFVSIKSLHRPSKEEIAVIRDSRGKMSLGFVLGQLVSIVVRPNGKNAEELDCEFIGNFRGFYVDGDGVEHVEMSSRMFLPTSPRDFLLNQLGLPLELGKHKPDGIVEFALEIFAEPSERSTTGLAYSCKPRSEQRAVDPLAHLLVKLPREKIKSPQLPAPQSEK